MLDIPRIVIAGTHSGCGKTTFSSGLMAALTARGYTVQPFKVGPDFIDPTHHTAICERSSRNLDPYMMGEDGVRATFAAACRGADIAVIEGVMGLYDGLDATDEASTAHVANILSAPVLLTVDVKGMSRSTSALVSGYAGFDPCLNLAGVVLNQVGSPRHRALIEPGLPVPAFGWLPKREDLTVASRHLGLTMAIETEAMAAFGEVAASACDLDGIVALARSAPPLLESPVSDAPRTPAVTIGVAHDPAFCFYYQDNLDRLRAAGAELVFFSPMHDRLPTADALYLGGGYPELHAAALAASRCREEIKRAIDNGMPVYGECGGLVYLTEKIEGDDGAYPMVGVFPAVTEMTGRFQGLGYVEVRVTGGPFASGHGSVYRGHEFHYSRVACDRDARFALALVRGKGIDGGRDGLFVQNALGQYTHAYFTNDSAAAITRAAKRYRRS